MKSELQITVNQDDTDELGHLNHVKAIEYLQSGRLDLYGLCGLRPVNGVEAFGTVVVNVDINFRKEFFLGDTVTVVTRPVSVGRKSFVVAQEIIRPDGQVGIDGRVTSVVMEMETRTIVPVPEILAKHFPGDTGQ